MTCPVCQARFTPAGRQRYCSSPCRKTAWRRRHQDQEPAVIVPAARPRRQGTIYRCADCDARYLGEQWCADCNRPCHRLGPGGACPCGELLTISELLDSS